MLCRCLGRWNMANRRVFDTLHGASSNLHRECSTVPVELKREEIDRSLSCSTEVRKGARET